MNHPLTPILKSVNKKSCPNSINFHCHTINSDGSLSSQALFDQANSQGLEHLAVTDHHCIKSFSEIMSYIQRNLDKKSIVTQVWPGIEITGNLKGCLVQIIGLGFDINSQYLDSYTSGNSVKGSLLEAKNIVLNIHKANGLAILAHPARYRTPYTELIPEAKIVGFDGIEVWYDYQRNYSWKPTPFICDQIEMLRINYELLASCGTDTHGISLLKR